MPRADRCAATAGDAFTVVDGCEVMDDMDGVVIALLFAQMAAHAADVTDLTGICAALPIGAGNDDIRAVGDGDDDLARADLDALHTARAFVRVYACDTADDMDGIKLTHGFTGAEAEAAFRTGGGPVAGDEHGGATVCDAGIASLGKVVLPTAFDHGDLLFDLDAFDTHDL